MRNVFVLILLIFSLQVKGQDIREAKLTWTISGLLDLNSLEEANYNCSFITDGTNDILWVQGKGKLITAFKIISTQDKWHEVKKKGRQVYVVSAEGEQGTLTFERVAGDIRIILDLPQSTGGHLKHRYNVTQISNDLN